MNIKFYLKIPQNIILKSVHVKVTPAQEATVLKNHLAEYKCTFIIHV